MSEQIKLIAQRIRELRELESLNINELAKELEVTFEEYTRYEDGETDIPVGFLLKIANRFNVELATLLTGASAKLRTYCVVRKDKGLCVNRRKEYGYQNLAFNFIDKIAQPFIVTVQPSSGDDVVAQYSHPGQEFNFVLEGSMKVKINNSEIILNEGDSLYFDSANKHGMIALNNNLCKFMAIVM
jgi:transcriptional regulator with XRE-family HTH domain